MADYLPFDLLKVQRTNPEVFLQAAQRNAQLRIQQSQAQTQAAQADAQLALQQQAAQRNQQLLQQDQTNMAIKTALQLSAQQRQDQALAAQEEFRKQKIALETLKTYSALGGQPKPQSQVGKLIADAANFRAQGNEKAANIVDQNIQKQTGLDASTKRQLNEDLLDMTNMVNDVNTLNKVADNNKDLFTYWGKNSVTWENFQSQLTGSELGPKAKARQEIEALAGQIFQKYRKQTTGSQAALQELDELQKIMLNPDLTYDQFKIQLNILQQHMQRDLKIKSDLLREGQYAPQSDEFWKAMDTRILQDQAGLGDGAQQDQFYSKVLEVQGKNPHISLAQLESTAKANNKTVDQIKQMLGVTNGNE